MPPKPVTRNEIRALLGRDGRTSPQDKLGQFRASDIELLFTYVADLRRDKLADFLAQHQLKKSGTKAEVVARLKAAVDEKELSYRDLIALLDTVQPWGKQHIFPLVSANADPSIWKRRDAAVALLRKHDVDDLLDKHKQWLLPDELRLSSIELSRARLRVTAVERRVGYERVEELDNEGIDPHGEPIEYRAYVQQTTRGLFAFEWDLDANEAFLQVTQLPMHESYEQAQQRFYTLVRAWLAVDAFSSLKLHSAITEFHRQEKEGSFAGRSHRVELEALDGRRIAGTSKAATQPLIGNVDIDDALETIRDNGAQGHLGNFYLISDSSDVANPITPGSDVHIMLLGNKNRINIMTPQREEVVRYAIRTVREAC
jgi:hypothetical protein